MSYKKTCGRVTNCPSAKSRLQPSLDSYKISCGPEGCQRRWQRAEKVADGRRGAGCEGRSAVYRYGFGLSPRRPRPPSRSSSRNPSSSMSAPRSATFQAYGREFSLALSDNERVLDKLPGPAQAGICNATACCAARSTASHVPGCVSPNPRPVSKAPSGTVMTSMPSPRYERIAASADHAAGGAPGSDRGVSPLRCARPVCHRISARSEMPAPAIAKQTALDQYQALVADLEGTSAAEHHAAARDRAAGRQ